LVPHEWQGAVVLGAAYPVHVPPELEPPELEPPLEPELELELELEPPDVDPPELVEPELDVDPEVDPPDVEDVELEDPPPFADGGVDVGSGCPVPSPVSGPAPTAHASNRQANDATAAKRIPTTRRMAYLAAPCVARRVDAGNERRPHKRGSDQDVEKLRRGWNTRLRNCKVHVVFASRRAVSPAARTPLAPARGGSPR
jgi:hypothetical protein